MKRLKQLTFKEIWKKIRRNWKVQYRFVVKNIDTHEEKLTFQLSIQRIFVVITVSAVCLIALTALLIAFTPLRVYVPGYTTPDEYRKYKKLAHKIEEVDKQAAANQQYIDNVRQILNDEIIVEEMEEVKNENEVKIKELEPLEEREWLDSERDRALSRKQNPAGIPLQQRADVAMFFPQAPSNGIVEKGYDLTVNHCGIDIKNRINTLVTSIEDGVVIYSGYEPENGNTIIIQHTGNMISKYQRNSVLLKTTGSRVIAGEPIAKMGESGNNEHGVHLHFELWYDGVPLNPSDYIFISK